MEYFLFFLITSTTVGLILYFVIEDLKSQKDIKEQEKKQTQQENDKEIK